jgi:hypothetical protein
MNTNRKSSEVEEGSKLWEAFRGVRGQSKVPPDEQETRSATNLADKDLVHEPAGQRDQCDIWLKSRNGQSGGREEECEQESADPAKGIDEHAEDGSVLCGHANPSRRLPAVS